MRVFVAGAAGAVGQQLLPQLAAGGHQVTGVDQESGQGRRGCAPSAPSRWWSTAWTPRPSARRWPGPSPRW